MKANYALSAIDKLINDYYSPPTSYYGQKKINFLIKSYEYSAINEIKKYIKENNKTEDIIGLLDDFRYKMDCFACESSNGDASFMFSVYYDVATDVLDYLLDWIYTERKKI